MSITEIDLSKQAKDATLTPAKISTNPADDFTFPGSITATTGVEASSTIHTSSNIHAGTTVQADDHLISDNLTGLSGGTVSINTNNSIVNGFQIINSASAAILSVDASHLRLGINTIAPLFSLDVTGTANISSTLTVPTINDTLAQAAISITNRQLKDASGVISLDWLNRLVKATDGSTSINFANPGTVDVTAVLDMNSNAIIHVPNPVNPNDAANKSYVDTAVQGLTIKAACEAATTANLSVTAAGSQVGKTLTATANGALVVDGYTANVNDRILVKNQATGSDNGIYTTTQTGDATTPFILTRATDFDNSATVASGDFTFINNGTVNASSGWVLSTPDPIVVDTTSLTFTQFSGAGEIIAGNGLTKTGNTLDVHPADASLTVHVGDIAVTRDPAGAIGLSGSGLVANVDNSTIDISGNNIEVKAGGITNTQVSSTAAIASSKLAAAGLSAQLQYNNGTTFAGASGLTTDGTNLKMTGGAIQRSGGSSAIDVNANTIYDTAGNGVILFQDKSLWDASGNKALAWSTTRTLHDSSGNPTVDWDAMTLMNDAGATMLDWSSTTVPSASVHIDSTTQGFMLPRMTTTQKNAISSPATGLLVYDTTLGYLQEYNGSTWTTVSPAMNAAGSNGQVQFNASGNFGANTNLFWDQTNHRLGILNSSPAQALHVGASGSPAQVRVDNNQANIFIGNQFQSQIAILSLNTANTPSFQLTPVGLNSWYIASPGSSQSLPGDFTIGQSIGASSATLVIDATSGNVAIANNFTATTPDASAVLALQSTTAGFLPPAMNTSQKNAISSPATGLLVYDTTLGYLQEYNGSTWTTVSPVTTPAGSSGDLQYNNGGSFGGTSNITTDGTNLTVTGSGAISLTTPNASSGAVSGGGISLSTGLNTGSGTTTGGSITLSTGACQSGSLNNGNMTGGSITLTTGLFVNGTGTPTVQGGSITLTTGQCQGSGGTTNVVGGSITLSTGPLLNNGTITGGSITLTTGTYPNSSGSNSTTGGSITLTSANSNGGSDTGGNIKLTSFTAANGGSLILTGTGANGTPAAPGHGNVYANYLNASTGLVVTTGSLNINTVAYTFPSSQGASSSVLTNNGSGTLTWGAAPLSTSLTSAHIFVGNASNVATDTALSGDVSITNTGVTSIASGLAAHIVTREVPSGTIDGTNTVFTLANTPVVGTECVFENGLLQQSGVGNDYTISGATITFTTAPDAGSRLLVNYIK